MKYHLFFHPRILKTYLDHIRWTVIVIYIFITAVDSTTWDGLFLSRLTLRSNSFDMKQQELEGLTGCGSNNLLWPSWLATI